MIIAFPAEYASRGSKNQELVTSLPHDLWAMVISNKTPQAKNHGHK